MKKPALFKRKYLVPLILWWVFIVVATSWPSSGIPSVSIDGVDKVVHFILYGVFTFLLYNFLFWGLRRSYRFSAIVSGFVAIVFGILNELYQPLVGRGCSIYDVYANSAGALTALLFVSLYRLIKRHYSSKKVAP